MRLEDWAERLAQFIAQRYAVPFAWGGNDCYLFVADAVLEVTGEDIAAEARSQYDDALGAKRWHDEHGGLETMFTAALGEPISLGFMQRGDVCLVPAPDSPFPDASGICLGADIAVVGPDRLTFVPRERARIAWPVGR